MKSRVILSLGFTLLCAIGPAIAADAVDSAFENQVNLSHRDGIRLSPKVRTEPLETAIPEIPLDTIQSFLVNHRVVASNELDNASYIVAGQNGHIVMGKGDRLYARGHFDVPEGTTFGIYQKGELYKDPNTGEVLGLQIIELGLARIEQIDGEIATMQLLSSNRDINVGDHLLPTLEQKLDAVFLPKPPAAPVEGKIIQVVGGVRNIGQYTSVVINRGKREGLASGNVLAVYGQGEQIRDGDSKKLIQLPPNRSGMLMVYRVFDTVSFGLVLNASKTLALHDLVKNP